MTYVTLTQAVREDIYDAYKAAGYEVYRGQITKGLGEEGWVEMIVYLDCDVQILLPLDISPEKAYNESDAGEGVNSG